ncbi:hypothetical protein M501DRAFT_998997 [Patellaria atrata CBS 101060]|uniref:Uncharacterized protein n=1 Tax=Patellaria atrata CBS 101060 TaxID=1346257 RepID=A0A9P4VLG5_9PEZI|nr:hypothetical protein M501DRAFT_998997 [Patellaria atrata CBS 101060]
MAHRMKKTKVRLLDCGCTEYRGGETCRIRTERAISKRNAAIKLIRKWMSTCSSSEASGVHTL